MNLPAGKNSFLSTFYRRTAEHVAHLHGIESSIYILYFFGGETDVCRSDILFQPAQFTGAGNGDYPRLLAQHPGERDLSGSSVFLLSQLIKESEQSLVLPEAFLLELGHGSTVIVDCIETVVFRIISGEQAVGKRRECHKADAQFF